MAIVFFWPGSIRSVTSSSKAWLWYHQTLLGLWWAYLPLIQTYPSSMVPPHQNLIVRPLNFWSTSSVARYQPMPS